MPKLQVPARVEENWRTFITTIGAHDPQKTITPSDLRDSEATKTFGPPTLAAPISVSDLPSVPVTTTPTSQGTPLTTDFEVRGILGEGGMGRVLLARQKSLQRDVALKVLKGTEPRRDVIDTLLVEAVTTGSIEHPSIVPVHALGRDKSGLPVLVMKRIDGVSWRQLFKNPDHPVWASLGVEAADRFDTHLEILMTVCNAVHYAHSRGIVHRDIKLDNVMIGGFGEVYLVDWGIAVHVSDLAAAPAAPEEFTMPVGTLAYMAPEMAMGDMTRIDARTDVYLLGATLHYLLVGKPRHLGKTPMELLLSARDSEPFDYGPEVSAELAAICHKAMHLDRDKRFSSALELRQALASYRRHRGSLALAAKAFAKMAEMDQSMNIEERRLRQAMTECRFAFMQALEAWSGNEAARLGLDEVLTRMIRHEIGRRDVEGARALLAELSRENPALAKDIDELTVAVERDKADAARLQAMARDTDMRVDARLQLLVLGTLPILGAVIIILLWVFRAELTAQPILPILGVPILTVVFLLALYSILRKRVTTEISRRAFAFLLLYPTSLVMHRGFALTQGDSLASMLMTDQVLSGILTVIFAITMMPSVLSVSLIFFAGAVATVVFPAYAVPLMVGTSTLTAILMFAIWDRMSKKSNERIPS